MLKGTNGAADVNASFADKVGTLGAGTVAADRDGIKGDSG